MSVKSEIAVELFDEGYNCAQSAGGVFAEMMEVDEGTVFRIASGFGGGIARGGDICGAVSGAIMALGLKCFDGDEVQKSKAQVYEIAKDFKERFAKQHKSIVCRELLGVDIGTAEGAAKFAEEDMHHKICSGLVRDAVEIIEEMIKED